MAQDFYAAFDIGPDDKHIGPIDECGVALAAIQGLNHKLEQRATALEQSLRKSADQNTKLQVKVDDLQAQLDRLQSVVSRLAAKSTGPLAFNTQSR
jgi:hypothetical protein